MGIAYEKYEYMDKRRLVNALINAEKKEEKLKADTEEKLKDIKELIKYLKAKIKKSLEVPKYYTLETSPAIKKIEKWEKENPELSAQIDRELAEEEAEWAKNAQ